MTTGALIFAENNSDVDYIKLAVFAASRVKEYLGIPVSLVTTSREWLEEAYPNHGFDQVIDVDNTNYGIKQFYDGSLTSKKLKWRNLTRCQAYDLTPYDKTLVLDSDFIVNSSTLKLAFDNDYDFQIYKNSNDLSGWRSVPTRVSDHSVPFYWATVFLFQKNYVTKAFFDLVKYIKENWNYFKTLYSIDAVMFRNDYAFSIAIHIMNGKTNGEFAVPLPGSMNYTIDRDVLVSIDGTKMKFLVEKEKHLGEYLLAKTTSLDVHVMNKMSLARFIDGGLGV